MRWGFILALLMPGVASAQGDEATHLIAMANQTLSARYPDEAYRLHVRVKRIEGIVEGAAGLRLDFPAEDRLPRGTTQVKMFTGSDEGGWQKAGWALLYITHYDSVVVAHNAVHTGDEMTPNDVSAAWIETTTLYGALLSPSEWRALVRAEAVFATRSIGEGRVVRQHDLRTAYAAETGETVMMRFERGSLHIDLACTARQKGHVDDEVRLYSADTGKTYRARLTGPGTATWIATL